MSDLFTQARSAAKEFIQRYVERGDSYEHLKESWMESWNERYRAGIGVSAGFGDCRAKRGPDALVVSRLGNIDVCFEFSLKELFHEIRTRREQLLLFTEATS